MVNQLSPTLFMSARQEIKDCSVIVVMCVKNGALYIEQQLKSIEAQTVRPKKICVYDWSSEDGSSGIVEEFAKTTPLEVVFRLMPQPQNVCKSYHDALSDALLYCDRVDLVALSDQDDIWLPEKLEDAVREWKSRRSSMLFYSDVSLIDAHGEELQKSRYLSSKFFKGPQKKLNAALFLANPIVGMTIVCTPDIVEHFIELDAETQQMHDWSLVLCAFASGATFVQAESSLVRYRQHELNVLGSSSSQSAPLLLLKLFRRTKECFVQFNEIKRLFPNFVCFDLFSYSMAKEIMSADFITLRYKVVLLATLPAGKLRRLFWR